MLFVFLDVVTPSRILNYNLYQNDQTTDDRLIVTPYLMQRVQWIHLVMMVFTSGPIFLSSTALERERESTLLSSISSYLIVCQASKFYLGYLCMAIGKD